MKIAIALTCFFILGTVLTSIDSGDIDESKLINKSSTGSKHVELGAVNWIRDFEKGKSLASETGKPMFVLFQEIPGCQTCRDYGNQPLSHPLVVEAIEDLFVPVAIFNNKPGTDAQLLKKFGEPSWNNPVVRYLNSQEADIIDRKDRVWSTDGTILRMIEALAKAGKVVPHYLHLAWSASPSASETAEFAMHCYWEGEAKLGGINGVHATRSGWRNGLEVVQLQYSPSIVDYKTLLDAAQKFNCATKVFTHTETQHKIATDVVGAKAVKADGAMRDAKASDQKYYLAHTKYRHLPLTEQQATKINVLAKHRKSADDLLSPRQKQLLQAIVVATQKDKNALKEFAFPREQRKLAGYQQKLVSHLKNTGMLQ